MHIYVQYDVHCMYDDDKYKHQTMYIHTYMIICYVHITKF
jgi:hypothetical protein